LLLQTSWWSSSASQRHYCPTSLSVSTRHNNSFNNLNKIDLIVYCIRQSPSESHLFHPLRSANQKKNALCCWVKTRKLFWKFHPHSLCVLTAVALMFADSGFEWTNLATTKLLA
jgi:hypothetical protein